MLNIVFFGPPGSGKGTQAKRIISKYNLIHVSTGDLLRNEIVNETFLGEEAQYFINKGKLVPDNIVISMIKGKLDELLSAKNKGVIFDGFPRTVKQAKIFDQMLEERRARISCVLSLNVSEVELISRIAVRAKHSKRIDDSESAIIHRRIAEYFSKTKPIEDYYTKQGKLRSVNGEGHIDEITGRIIHEIDKVIADTIS